MNKLQKNLYLVPVRPKRCFVTPVHTWH